MGCPDVALSKLRKELALQDAADEVDWEVSSADVKAKKLVSSLQFLKGGLALEQENRALKDVLAGKHAVSTARKPVVVIGSVKTTVDI